MEWVEARGGALKVRQRARELAQANLHFLNTDTEARGGGVFFGGLRGTSVASGPSRLRLMSEWWRWDGWPTAAEWQAWWALVALIVAGVLLYVAWKQLSGLAQSNEELSRSNELLTASNRAISRPVIVVEYSFEAFSARNFADTESRNVVYIVIRNIGASAARDVRLSVSPPFQRAGTIVTLPTPDDLNELFNGVTTIKMLAPNQQLKYPFDGGKAALNSKAVPAEYTVSAAYTDLQRSEEFSDDFVLHMAPWGFTPVEEDPLQRISKDIQFMTESLREPFVGMPGLVREMRDLSMKIHLPASAVKTTRTPVGRPRLRSRMRGRR